MYLINNLWTYTAKTLYVIVKKLKQMFPPVPLLLQYDTWHCDSLIKISFNHLNYPD